MNSSFFAIILWTLIAMSGEEVSVDISPRIITNNGNLIFQSGVSKDIQFTTQGNSNIKFNDINIKDFYNQIKDVKTYIAQNKNQSNHFMNCNCDAMKITITSNTQKISNLRKKLKGTIDQLNTISVQVNELKQISITNECLNNPCHNGGTCIDGFGSYKCICTKQYKGNNCMDDVNECEQYYGTDLGCQNNARCENSFGSFRCICAGKWSGVLCNIPTNGCTGSSNADLCGHGTCVSDHSPNNLRAFNCFCDSGWNLDQLTKTCILDNNECTVGRYPCSADPRVPCYNTPGGFTCGQCPSGYTGNGFSCTDINECLDPNKCRINERCINRLGSYECRCVEGMTLNSYGVCHRQNICLINNGGCNTNAQCTQNFYYAEGRMCVCNRGYYGNGIGPFGCTIGPSNNTAISAYLRCVRFQLCLNGGLCQQTPISFRCQCTSNFVGVRCGTPVVNRCLQNPCVNGGVCVFLPPNNYICRCTSSFTGRNCETEHTACGGTIVSPKTERNITFNVSPSIDYSFRYPCIWIVLVSDEQFIQVKPIALSWIGSCSQEYLQIMEKSSSESESRELGKYCRDNTLSSSNGYNTSGPILIIKARLQNNDEGLHGFTVSIKPFNYLAQNVDCCKCLNGQHVITNASNGLFQSPHYPLNYPDRTNCIIQYERIFGETFKVVISINTIDLGDSNGNCSSSDYLKITFVERGPIIITSCNQGFYQNQRFTTSGFKIIFYSDSRISSAPSRFQLIWRKSVIQDPCGGILSFPISGIILVQSLSENQEAYCTWNVHHSNVSQLISLKGVFTYWQNGDCSTYIQILNRDLYGTTQILWHQCQNPNMIDDLTEQITGTLIIVFRKTLGVRTPSFQITFKYLCGKIVNMDEITSYELISSSYPDNYEDNLKCIYKFVARTRKFSINFIDFDVADDYPCTSDYLLIQGASRYFLNGKYCNGNKEYLIPVDKTPSSENLVITFVTNSSISGRGFRAMVTLYDCGGSYYLFNRLVITYPDDHINNTDSDISYESNKNCVWNIISPPGSYILALFDHFHLEYHQNCQFDYLSVSYDNVTDRRFCGNEIKHISTRSNKLKLVFKTDYSVNGEGFIMRAYVSSIETQCHKDFELSEGRISNPPIGTTPRPYICIYSITVPRGRKVVINVTIEEPLDRNYTTRNKCYGKGRLRIKNGFIGATTITEICRESTQRGLITTSFNKATIIYLVPAYGRLSEFNFTIWFQSIDEECGSIHTDDYGEIASPNYPLYAPVNTNCQWELHSTPGRQIKIKIMHIKSGSNSITNDCNINKTPVIKLISLSEEISISCKKDAETVYIFRDNIVRINFKNLANTQYIFKLSYRKICNLVINETVGRIDSNNIILNYPNYCSWTINILKGSTLLLQFVQFDLPNAINERCQAYVKITDSVRTLLNYTCGNTLIKNTYQTTNSPLVIKHYVDRRIPINILQSHSGFILEYNTQGCVHNIIYDPNDFFYYNSIQKQRGNIESPQYPNSVSNTDCIWTFTTIRGYSIKLKFNVIELDSFLNCSEGYILKARDSENINDPYSFKSCESITNNQPLIFQSSTHYLYLIFKSASDINGGHRKFQATYEFINTSCEYEITATEGIIMSPNYPAVYSMNLNCKWSLSVRQGMSIFLKFLDFQVEGNSCRYDYVQIFSTFNSETMPMIRLCGDYVNSSTHYTSINNQMLVTFKTDTSIQRRGFKAQFFEGCGGQRNATGENQLLLSPNYPHHYNIPFNICEWTITANVSNPGERIFFYFMGFESSTGDINGNCSLNMNVQSDNSITIIDGLEETPIIATLCSNRPSLPIISTSHFLRVKLKSSNGNAIFKANFGTGSSVCGGEFFLDTGIITSPFYPNAVNMEMNCLYIIKGNPGTEIDLTILEFSRTNDNSYEYHDFLEIRIGNATTNYLINRFYTLTDIQNATRNRRFNESVLLRFRSQGGFNTNAVKFLAQYHINYISLFEKNKGSLSSPQFGHMYSENTQRSWTINPIAQTIEIQFFNFSVGRKLHNDDCSRGKLLIVSSSGQSKTLCGSNLPLTETYIVPVTIMLVAEGYRYPGFLLSWSIPVNKTFIQTGNCRYTLTATQLPQILTSPNFPYFDPINRDCEWKIIAPKGRAISLNILNFTLENSTNCKYENFTISVQRMYRYNIFLIMNQRKTFCGTQNNNLLDYTNDLLFRMVTIKFQADQFDIFPGFKLQYQLKCFQEVYEIEGWLKNDEFPNYITQPKNCTYKIKLGFYRDIQLNVTGLSLPPKTNNDCRDGYIEIFTYFRIGKYCGKIIPGSLQPLLIDTNEVTIKLVGSFNSSSTYSGFQLQYKLQEVECGGTHILSRNTDEIEISYPRKDNSSPSYIECKWYISSPYGTRMKIDFQKLLIYPYQICNESFLTLFDGSTILSKKIGNKNYCHIENSVLTTGNRLLIFFQNKVSHTDFQIRVSVGICGGSLYKMSDTIFSTNYPHNYPKEAKCVWKIILIRVHNVAIRFDDFSLSNDCSNSKIIISSNENELVYNYSSCVIPPPNLNIMSDIVTITFNTNTTRTKRGFKLSYMASQLSCGRESTGPSGEEMSINYPASIPPYTPCSWVIKTDITKRVTITIKKLTVQNNCLRIYSIKYFTSKVICESNLENFKIDTKSSQVRITLEGDGNNRLFFSYKTDLPSLCGSHIYPGTNDTGLITFNSTSYCHHIMHNYDGNIGTIALRVVQVVGINCRGDDVSIESIVSEGIGTNSIIDKLQFCNHEKIYEMLTTMGKSVDIIVNFRSRLNVTNKKVAIMYKYQNCGGFITEPFGYITSPNYPNKYPHNSDCEWIIRSEDNMHIKLTINLLHLEQNEMCRYDHLIIRSGPEYNSLPMHTFCGRHNITNETIIFRNNLLRISFKSDNSVAKDGFSIQYNFINAVDNCNGFIFNTSGFVQSPNYPNPYPPNTKCNWTISVPYGYQVELTVQQPFDLEPRRGSNCDYDALLIIDSNLNKIIAQLCGNIPPTKPILSSENRVGIYFSTDHNLNLDGFRINYKTVCGGIFNNTYGQIKSPNVALSSGRYIMPCSYIVPGWKRYLTVLKIRPSLNFCRYLIGYVEIWKEVRPGQFIFSQNICGRSKNEIIIFNPLSILIKYNITYSLTKIFSFSATYLHEENIKLYTNFTKRILITTPHFPTLYHHNADLQWQFQAPKSYIFHIEIQEINIEPSSGCIYDYVAFYSGNNTNATNLIDKLCGKRKRPILFRIESNNILIHFLSDSSHFDNHTGFKSLVISSPGPQLGCGGNIVLQPTSVGYISSVDLNNDGQYENGLYCEWRIFAPNGYRIELRFENSSVSLERRSRKMCIYDSLNVYDGLYQGNSIIRSLCGNDTVDTIKSSTSNLFVLFQTDYSIQGRGFKIHYSAILSQNHVYVNVTNNFQTLTSPGYPDNTNYNLNIVTEILAPNESDHILIKIRELLLRPTMNCSLDKFLISDLSSRYINQLQRFCKPVQFPASFISSGNKVIIIFNVGVQENQNNVDIIRYKIDYKIYSCNRTEKAYSGRIFNIENLKDNIYSHNTICNLTLEAPSTDLKFQFYFKRLMLESSATCNYDYIQFTFGKSNEQQYTLPKICGNNIPPSFVSNSSYVTMMFVTDNSVALDGFDITYVVNRDSQQTCGGEIDLDSGVVTSPGYGRNIFESGNCIWNIVTVSDKSLSWKITDLQLGSNATMGLACTSTSDFLQITHLNQVKKFCGNTYPREYFEMSTNQISVEYKSDSGGTGVGFRLEWKSVIKRMSLQ